MISNLNVSNVEPKKKRALPTREELARMKRILAEIPVRRKMKEEQLIYRYNFQKNQEVQQLKNERDRVISLEHKLIASLRYKLPTSTGGEFDNIAKDRLEQLDMQYVNELRKINRSVEKHSMY